jgi:hypothetical protein
MSWCVDSVLKDDFQELGLASSSVRSFFILSTRAQRCATLPPLVISRYINIESSNPSTVSQQHPSAKEGPRRRSNTPGSAMAANLPQFLKRSCAIAQILTQEP